MDCNELVDALLQDEALIAMLPVDQTGKPAIYQILSPQADLFPRIAVFETTRGYSAYADDEPTEERSEYRIDFYSRDNQLRGINAALHRQMRALGFARLANVQDDYLPDERIFVKSARYEHYQNLMEE